MSDARKVIQGKSYWQLEREIQSKIACSSLDADTKELLTLMLGYIGRAYDQGNNGGFR